MIALRAEGLAVSYAGRPALAGVTLEIPQGQITALIGPSGCGKTTFLSCLNRLTDLIPGCKVTGRLTAGGQDVRSVDASSLRRRVGMIFQNPNPFPMSIRRNLEFPMREHGERDARRLAARVEAALQGVGLWDEVKDRLDRPALGLSGGQQQRLCLARALALEPEALLLDEPCSALDPLAGGKVEELLVALRGKITLVVVTHNLAQARRIADRAALFWVREGVGGLVEEGPTTELFGAPREMLTAEYVSGERG